MRYRLICCLLPLFLVGCNLMYRPEMRQGTLLTDEALASLKPGLTKRQVRLVIGSPSINDPFHPDRWDYVYSLVLAGDKAAPPPRLTLYFENDQLVRAEGELVPDALKTATETPPSTDTLPSNPAGDEPN